ncbi:MAG TPA: hypothetical protein VG708_13165 [Mycobacteriales bacterium]|nr:hypothetical protein [Mycobacteriales bacterium]
MAAPPPPVRPELRRDIAGQPVSALLAPMPQEAPPPPPPPPPLPPPAPPAIALAPPPPPPPPPVPPAPAVAGPPPVGPPPLPGGGPPGPPLGAGDASGAGGLVELTPQARREKAEAVRKTDRSKRRLNPGDLICGQCGEGNSPTRRFCSRCGESLAGAEVVKRSWWRRLVAKLTPRPRKPKSVPSEELEGVPGARPARHHRQPKDIIRSARKVLAVFLIFGAGLGAALAPVRNWVVSQYESVKHKITNAIQPSYEPVHAARITWTAAGPRHPGTKLGDGFKNTYWNASTSVQDPSVTFHFGKAVTLSKAIVYNGGGSNFQNEDRVHDLHVVYSTGHATDLDLKDTADPQTLSLSGAKNITSITFEVESRYNSNHATRVRLTEIELFHLKV